MDVLKEIEKKTPVGTRLGFDCQDKGHQSPDYHEKEVTGHKYLETDRLQINLCDPTGSPGYVHIRADGTSLNGNTIERNGGAPIEILSSRD